MSSPLRLRGPADLVAVLPYQLGYHPSSSLVLVAFHDTRMGLVQRLDLPGEDDVGVAAEALLGPLVAEQPDSVLLFGYEEREGASIPMLDATASACASAGIRVQDRIVVRAGRWFSPDCGPPCCPMAGTPLPEPGDLPVVAEFVGREIAPLRDRAALVDSLRPRDLARGRRIARLARTMSRARERAAAPGGVPGHFWEQDLRAWGLLLRFDDDATAVEQLEDALCAALAVSLGDLGLRDAVVSWLCPGSMPAELVEPELRQQVERALPERAWGGKGPLGGEALSSAVAMQRVERRLVTLCGCLDDQWAVAPLTVLAAFAWWRGDGALSRVALDRALQAAPDYRLALLLEQMVDLAIRPDRRSA